MSESSKGVGTVQKNENKIKKKQENPTNKYIYHQNTWQKAKNILRGKLLVS